MDSRPRNSIKVLGILILGGAFLGQGIHVSSAQTPIPKENTQTRDRIGAFKNKSVLELIAGLNKNPNSLGVVHRLRELGDVTAIPPLREAFVRVKLLLEKQVIAAALVSLGSPEEEYWALLAQSGTAAAETDMPNMFQIDKEGNIVGGKLNPAFADWLNKNQARFEKAMPPMYVFPGNLAMLGFSGDPRAVPILLTAMENSNYLINTAAARALAQLQVKRAIPAIIQACERAPASIAEGIASALPYFDDPTAQAAAQRFIKNTELLKGLQDDVQRQRRKGH